MTASITPRDTIDHRDFEAPIGDALAASLALTNWVEDNIASVRERDSSGWRVIRLTGEELKVLYYLIYAVQGHARQLASLFDDATQGNRRTKPEA